MAKKDEACPSASESQRIVLACKEKKPKAMMDELARRSLRITLWMKCCVMRWKTPQKHIWEKLEQMFTDKSLLNKLFLKEELLNLQMEKGVNMMEHLSTFNRCIADL